jgi:hypothetical protein
MKRSFPGWTGESKAVEAGEEGEGGEEVKGWARET